MQGLQGLKKSIDSAGDLKSIVGTMKAHASSNINQFQNAAKASREYRRVLDMSLYVVLSGEEKIMPMEELEKGDIIHFVFGSDHGLAGRFNERIVEYALQNIPKSKDHKVITIGQQALQRLRFDLDIIDSFNVPQTTDSISSMVTNLLVRIDELRDESHVSKIILYYNKPKDNYAFEEETETLFPIDLSKLIKADINWESKSIPTYFSDKQDLLADLIRQYIFITLYRTFCYSLASENASRLSSMQSAEKNIEERLVELNQEYRRERQNSITEEINDVISGFKAIRKTVQD
ncbi:MAG: FoF1 ATP synthase subunit gamma [Gudongella sp.]|nr:FoF1 ATP synthase subunit gamma [Gudongella sp.]